MEQFVALDLLMPVRLSLLLQDDGQVLFTLFLELSNLLFGLLQLHGHAFHLLPRVTDLEEAVAQLVHLLPQLQAFLRQQPETFSKSGQCRYLNALKPEGKFLLFVSRHQL